MCVPKQGIRSIEINLVCPKALFTGGSEIRVSEFWGYNILPQEGFDFFVTPHKKN